MEKIIDKISNLLDDNNINYDFITSPTDSSYSNGVRTFFENEDVICNIECISYENISFKELKKLIEDNTECTILDSTTNIETLPIVLKK